jgi:hypothetical protein
MRLRAPRIKPVKPGGKGTVEVTFDPKDRYGDFSIGLTVIAGNGNYRKFNTLVVKGYVISRIPEAEIRYPYALSAALRADNRAIGMRQRPQTHTAAPAAEHFRENLTAGLPDRQRTPRPVRTR